MLTITKKNDQFVTLPKLRVAATGAYLNAATVIGTLYDRANAAKWKANPADPTIVAVTGFNALPGIYDGGSTGTYNIPIEQTFDPPKGGGYLLVITAVQTGQDLEVEIPVTIAVRTS